MLFPLHLLALVVTKWFSSHQLFVFFFFFFSSSYVFFFVRGGRFWWCSMWKATGLHLLGLFGYGLCCMCVHIRRWNKRTPAHCDIVWIIQIEHMLCFYVLCHSKTYLTVGYFCLCFLEVSWYSGFRLQRLFVARIERNSWYLSHLIILPFSHSINPSSISVLLLYEILFRKFSDSTECLSDKWFRRETACFCEFNLECFFFLPWMNGLYGHDSIGIFFYVSDIINNKKIGKSIRVGAIPRNIYI